MDRSGWGRLIAATAMVITLGGCANEPAEGLSPHEDIVRICTDLADPAQDCLDAVEHLNDVLATSLSAYLPEARALNNLFNEQGRPVGGAEPTFVPKRTEDGKLGYETAIRLRRAGLSATLTVAVEQYRVAKEHPHCPDEERAADLKSKGVVVHRCDRTVRDGSVLRISDQSEPYGTSGVLLRTLSVMAYRGDETKVIVLLSPVVERPAQVEGSPPGDQPTMLELERVIAWALEREFTLAE